MPTAASARLVHRASELDVALNDLPTRPPEVGVVLADPAFFDVEYVINAHMVGNIGSVDRARARRQWEALRQTYAGLGYDIHVLDPVPGLPDLVFMANQSFPARLPTGQWAALLSYMHAPERRGEVEHVAAWYRDRDAHLVHLADAEVPFEGMGDCLWLPGRRGVVAGHGFRTQPRALGLLCETLDVPVLALELVDARFYHLDTCLSLITESTALWVPDAFTAEGRQLLQQAFDTLVEVPLDEATELLACNGHCPDRQHFIVQAGAERTNAAARALGLTVLELDTTEFLKSGGSVYCMKLMLP